MGLTLLAFGGLVELCLRLLRLPMCFHRVLGALLAVQVLQVLVLLVVLVDSDGRFLGVDISSGRRCILARIYGRFRAPNGIQHRGVGSRSYGLRVIHSGVGETRGNSFRKVSGTQKLVIAFQKAIRLILSFKLLNIAILILKIHIIDVDLLL